jgi:hypothetical protein
MPSISPSTSIYQPATIRSAAVETTTSAASLCLITLRLSLVCSIVRLVRPKLPMFVNATTHHLRTSLHCAWPAFHLCLTTDCTIPERDPCVSKQQLHFEPGRPLFLPPMTAMLSRLGSPKPGRRSGVGYVTALDPLQSPLPINTYLFAVVLLYRVSVSPYPTLSQSPHLTRRIV